MDATFLLKNGRLYEVGDVTKTPVDMAQIGGKYQLLIDDSNFFYISMGKMALSRKKLKPIASNYIRGQFPADLFAGFAICEIGGEVILLLYTEVFGNFLKNNVSLFQNADKVSTAFCELVARYESFIFTDSKIIYEKSQGSISQISSEIPGTLKASEVYEAVLPLKSDLSFEGVKREASFANYAVVGILLGVCYLLFLSGGLFHIAGLSKQNKLASAELERHYEEAGVINSGDPYGVLREKAGQGMLAPYKILPVLASVGEAAAEAIKLETVVVNDRIVRFEGSTASFATVEEYKRNLEAVLKKSVTLDESRETGGSVRFAMRFEP